MGIVVFLGENEDRSDDAHFLPWPDPDDRWVNMPADRHGQTGVLTFADGHAERLRWKFPKQFKQKQSYWKKAENPADLADLRRGDDLGSEPLIFSARDSNRAVKFPLFEGWRANSEFRNLARSTMQRAVEILGKELRHA